MTTKLKKSTIDFIQTLLEKELKAEYIFDAPNPDEVEYIKDLEKAALDFASYTENPWVNGLIVRDLIGEIHRKENK
jgi:hypothetical protein